MRLIVQVVTCKKLRLTALPLGRCPDAFRERSQQVTHSSIQSNLTYTYVQYIQYNRQSMSRLPLPNGGLQHSSSSYNSSLNRPDSPGQSPAMDTRKKQSKRDEVS